jgi:hypothetical protein
MGKLPLGILGEPFGFRNCSGYFATPEFVNQTDHPQAA